MNNIALSAPTGVGFVVLACATTLAIRCNLGNLVIAYLAAQTLFCLANLWVMQKWLPQDRAYLAFFGFLGIVLVFDLLLAICWLDDFWTGSLCFVALVTAAFFSGLRLWQCIAEKAPPEVLAKNKFHILLILVQSGIMLVCGVISLLYLCRPLSPELNAAALCCGLYWTLTGAWGWAFAGSLGKWQTANYFVSPFVTIACFGWLAVMLSGAQPELARQHIADESVVELVWEETT